jgi:hypothetical protein
MPPPSKRNSLGSVLMVLLGIVLILPGMCTLIFVGSFAITDPRGLFNSRDPYMSMAWVLWLICLAVAAVGILLIRYATRR